MKSAGLTVMIWLNCAVSPALSEHELNRDVDRKMLRDGSQVMLSEVLFVDSDRRILDEYLRTEQYGAVNRKHGAVKDKQKALPPGLRKKLARDGYLPPGWQKKIARWEVMDDDLYRHSTDLPEHILRQLSSHPTGTSIRRIEDRVLRIMDATHTILDVLSAGHQDY